ncbi:hypothetical protein NAP1_04980 [Erythrobacter sp. NAP1]|uniref:hypothetical protein n=1 Tax=Erythrobacter sp. NAP1 TaxID=237727 RepID=UPI0000686B30|nr:hypothetical protein [Erythrobacter sp. NAP1]EAQ30102.1 hypothetical protein NAP1_04980 [Erythrobacter sp. NAP1]
MFAGAPLKIEVSAAYVLSHDLQIVLELIDRSINVDGSDPSADPIKRAQDIFQGDDAIFQLVQFVQR